jgi:hypothetical protein
VLLVMAACGRTDDENHGNNGGGPAGGSAGSSGGAAGGKAGFGGSAPGGASGKGGSTTDGGASGEGNAGNAGGSAGSDAGAGGTGSDFVPLGESSWDTTLALRVTKQDPTGSVHCTATSFTLHFSPAGSNLKVIGGRDGSVLKGELLRGTQSSPSYSVTDALPVPTRGDCNLNGIDITELTLQASDETGDGVADGIAGSGKARGNFILGDQGFTAELSFTLQGVPDSTKPSLLAPSNPHPLDGTRLRTTEPVALSSSVTLTPSGAGGASEPLTGYTATDGAFGTFSSPRILPFGSTWKLSATGGDLANLPFDSAALPSLAVLADPGVFAEDGFEGTPAVTLTGNANIVTSVGTLPAITGSKSLFVPSGSSATLHLARPIGANSVHFTGRVLTTVSGATVGGPDVEAGVIGGSLRVRPTQALPSTPTTSTNDSKWLYAGPAQEITLPLTESGTDVAIRVTSLGCMGICPPAGAFLIDDLRVE